MSSSEIAFLAIGLIIGAAVGAAFSLTAGALFGFMARRWGVWAGAASAGAWALQPQLFGHGHYAAYDGLLTVSTAEVYSDAAAPRTSTVAISCLR